MAAALTPGAPSWVALVAPTPLTYSMPLSVVSPVGRELASQNSPPSLETTSSKLYGTLDEVAAAFDNVAAPRLSAAVYWKVVSVTAVIVTWPSYPEAVVP